MEVSEKKIKQILQSSRWTAEGEQEPTNIGDDIMD